MAGQEENRHRGWWPAAVCAVLGTISAAVGAALLLAAQVPPPPACQETGAVVGAWFGLGGCALMLLGMILALPRWSPASGRLAVVLATASVALLGYTVAALPAALPVVLGGLAGTVVVKPRGVVTALVPLGMALVILVAALQLSLQIFAKLCLGG